MLVRVRRFILGRRKCTLRGPTRIRARPFVTFSRSAEEYPESYSLKTQRIPAALRTALEKLFRQYPRQSLQRDGVAFNRYLANRRTLTVNGLSGEWENVGQSGGPLTYRKYEGVLYAATWLPSSYAAIRRVLHEINAREGNFQPKSLLDFGSGIGTSVWAAHDLFGDTIKEYVCIDDSEEMNGLASYLLNGGEDKTDQLVPDHYISGMRFRRLLSSTFENSYDIVIALYTLGDLADLRQKRAVIRELWKQTGKFLVLLERGNLEGSRNILLARETILKKIRSQDSSNVGFVYAPCTHDLVCPHTTLVTKLPCHFGQRAELSLVETDSDYYKSYGYKLEKFSYVVFKKGDERPENSNYSLHRVIGPEKRRSGHVVCKLCTQQGHLVQTVVPKSKGRTLYKHSRQLKWGDHLLQPRGVELKFLDLYPRSSHEEGS
ncbi:ribosome assembly protein METTL17, mitochondrial-like [Oscarella lobularis]|uniref:ribosome assembly protein METTL17, mitochondrial-like n=1 Tax=Oscarella lobularis TaxID=121494 RepID=UPI003313831B